MPDRKNRIFRATMTQLPKEYVPLSHEALVEIVTDPPRFFTWKHCECLKPFR